MFGHFGITHACDGRTDGQADGHAWDDSKYRASIASRG